MSLPLEKLFIFLEKVEFEEATSYNTVFSQLEDDACSLDAAGTQKRYVKRQCRGGLFRKVIFKTLIREVRKIMSLLRKWFCYILCLSLLTVAGCGVNTDSKMNKSEIVTHFAIVLVKGVSTDDAIKTKLEELPLETQPLLTDKDLISYYWKEHKLELRQDFKINDSFKNIPLNGVPFILIADDKRVYLGALWTPISSLAASIPTITVLPSDIQKNVIKIESGYPFGTTDIKSDPRSNQLIYNALKSIGKIKE